MKVCYKCKRELDNYFFGKLKSSRDGYRYDCKDCRKKYNISVREHTKLKNKEYYETNKDIVLKTNKKYRENNKENISLHRKEYRNREEVKLYNKEKQKEYLETRKTNIKNRRLTDLDFKMCEVLRAKLHRGLKGYNTSYMKILGCDIDFFKKWIEYRFDNSMNWGNYGVYWHIDHILPINQFDLKNDNDIHICFHWTNLQPLYSKENQSKSDKILLHYFFNNMINIFRFNNFYKQYLGYQAVNESLQWLRSKLRYGNNSLYEGSKMSEIDNPQPSL